MSLNTKTASCPSCGKRDRFWMVGQELSIEPRNLRVRVERVILGCRACKAVVAVERGGARLWKEAVEAQPGEPVNGRARDDDRADSDLPRLFRR